MRLRCGLPISPVDVSARAPIHSRDRRPRRPTNGSASPGNRISHLTQTSGCAPLLLAMISLIIPEITETPLWWWCPSFSLRLFRPPLRFLLLLFTLHSTEGLLPAGSSPGPYPNPNPTDLVGDGRARASRRRRRGEAPDPGGGEEAGARAALLFRKSALLNLGSFLRG